ncbi:phosphoglycolate phosphatase 2-like [Bactrocera tryoni]|uniref:phosphoglycolate phosphatase 2-like n=1 Tax=Bactrocera tryoni TaxID=59916 RepID=UPI001A98EE03|nr:phosphoglycolate phosphatase 2-like [Bactrocera tryoni]
MEHKVNSKKSSSEPISELEYPQNPNAIKYLNELTLKQKQDFFDSFDVILSDCDGVIWHSLRGDLLPGTSEAIDYLKRQGKEVIYVTNNSITPIDTQLKKFERFGIEVKKHEIMHPAQTICDYLKSIQFDGLIFCLTSEAFKSLLREAGFNVVEELVGYVETLDDLLAVINSDDPVKAVITDADFNLTGSRLMRAHGYLRKNPDCLFIGGAAETIFTVGGNEILGAGTILSVLENTTQRKALIFGKPGVALRDFIMEKLKIKNARRCLFIGDSIVADIRFAKVCGFQSLLVLTGSTTPQDLQSKLTETDTPDYVSERLADLNGFLS